MRPAWTLAAAALVIWAAEPAGAQPRPATVAAAGDADGALEANVRRLSAELRCPVCQGLSLADSPAELSQEMQAVIRRQLAEGKSPDEVKAYFVDRYGEWILLEPKPHGWNLLVYALPAALLIGGLGGVLYLARRWTAASATAPAPVPTHDAGDDEVIQ